MKYKKGFTLVEILIVVFVFTLITISITATYTNIFNLLSANKTKIAALDLGDEQIEIIRNLAFSQVGEVSGIPVGVIPHVQTITRNGVGFQVTTTIRNIDDAFDGTIGGTPKDLAPADYKLAQIDISCTTCKNFAPVSLTTYVAPKNLEGASTNGALFVKVFDASGAAVQGADVHITNASSTIIIDDVTDASGMLQIVDVPPATNAYSIAVSKAGYSSDRTYPPGGGGNPNPNKPSATVAVQQVTQVSFAIDELSDVAISTVGASCAAIGSVPFTISGAKTIGTNVLKYSASKTSNSIGQLAIPDLEWDTYSIGLTGSTYDLIGTNPLLPTNLLPDSTQNIVMVIGPKTPASALITIKDTSGLAITGATVTLTKSGIDNVQTTGRGFVKQTDWTGGSGQTDMSNASKYYASDGNVDATTVAGQLQIRKASGNFVSSGNLTSSIFDMGTTTNFNQILWSPSSQPVQSGTSSVRFQIATSNENTSTTTWNYVGPDGTSATYFTAANQNINTAQNNTQFIRYKVYLSTNSAAYTPSVSDVFLTFTSSCVPPGQVYFSGLSAGTYTLAVTATGYQNFSTSLVVSSTSTVKSVTMNP